MGGQQRSVRGVDSNLVGGQWEKLTLEGVLDRAITSHGGVHRGGRASRHWQDASRRRRLRDRCQTRCRGVPGRLRESHASNIPFHAVVGFLRAITGIGDLGGAEARALLRTRMPGADQQDLLLLDDLLGIGDPAVVLPRSLRMHGVGGSSHWSMLTRSAVNCPGSSSSRTRIGSTRSANR